MHNLNQIFLRSHHALNRLIRSWRFIQHTHILTAFNTFNRLQMLFLPQPWQQILTGEQLRKNGPTCKVVDRTILPAAASLALGIP